MDRGDHGGRGGEPGEGPVIPFIAIGGTWAWNGSSRGQWYDPGSPWSANMRARGLEHHHLYSGAPRPFVWTTDLEGNQWWRRLIGKPADVTEWQAAGQNLFAYCVPPIAPGVQIAACNLHIIAHSHAAQVVAFACADGLRVNTLITVGSPIRADMLQVYRRARANIGFHWHFHSDSSDRFQWLGAFGDGRIGIVRRHPFADQNVGLPGVGHSDILNNMRLFADVWSGPIDLIRSRHGRSEFTTDHLAHSRQR